MSSLLAWTSPTRKCGRLLLPVIPNEIYLEIFSYLRPDPDSEEAWIAEETRHILCNLALVCRFFSSVMLPWIFENIRFVEGNPYAQSNQSITSSVSTQFCRSVVDGESTALVLSEYIKRCAFVRSSSHSAWSPLFFSLYFDTLKHMPNLLELSLTRTVIPKVFFKCISNILRLKKLKIDCCFLDGAVEEKHLKKLKGLHLQSFILHDTNDLHHLLPYLDLSHLLRLELKISSTFDTLPIPHQRLPLESLVLETAQDLCHLAKFLTKTPSLQVLRVLSSSSTITWPEGDLQMIHIPILAEIEADWSLCQVLVPGRPIFCLKVVSSDVELGLQEIQVMKKSTRAITSLKVPPELYLKVPFSEHFPDLRELEIAKILIQPYRGNTWSKMIKELIHKWNRHPDLHILTLEFFRSHFRPSATIDSEEMNILTLLESTFPSLVTAQLVHFHNCFCTYTRSGTTAWHRTVA